jgi:mono/diheme cytochrome c family protein
MTATRPGQYAIAFAAAALLLPAERAPSAPAVQQQGGRGSAGRDIFVRKGCFECHGYSGQGADTGPKLAPGTIPFSMFGSIVRNPPNQMPAYSRRVLSDAELADIYAYLLSVQKPRPVQDIPILRILVPPAGEAGH